MSLILLGATALALNALLHIPYLFNDPDSRPCGAGSQFLMGLININWLDYDPFDEHWWWDNATHALWGVTFGALLAVNGVSLTDSLWFVLGISIAWEGYEYGAKERPWHVDQNGERLWSFDHAMEDTVLDTLMALIGTYGVYLL